MTFRVLFLVLVLTPPPISTAAEGAIALRVRSVAFTREGSRGFGGAARTMTTASAQVVIEVGARSPQALEALLPGPLPGQLTARDDRGRSVALRGEVVVEDGKPVLRLHAEALSPDARRLVSVQGQLRTFAGARRIRFHVPWLKDEVPLSVHFDGGTAVLKRFQLVGADSTLWVGITPPDGYRVIGLAQPGALTARAVDIDGNLVNGGGITRIEPSGIADDAEFRFQAPGLRRTPSRLVLDVLCVSGEVRSVPFKLENIPFPARPPQKSQNSELSRIECSNPHFKIDGQSAIVGSTPPAHQPGTGLMERFKSHCEG